MTAETTDVERNRKLAANIAAGNSPLDLKLEQTLRANAEANLDVPGPRVVQLLDEVDRLRRVLLDIRTGIDKAL